MTRLYYPPRLDHPNDNSESYEKRSGNTFGISEKILYEIQVNSVRIYVALTVLENSH
jgi:hypothetical protein